MRSILSNVGREFNIYSETREKYPGQGGLRVANNIKIKTCEEHAP